jgi:hypothetical protein
MWKIKPTSHVKQIKNENHLNLRKSTSLWAIHEKITMEYLQVASVPVKWKTKIHIAMMGQLLLVFIFFLHVIW